MKIKFFLKKSSIIIFFFSFFAFFSSTIHAVASWTATGTMSVARAQHTATLLSNGKVIVAGNTSFVASTRLYNPATNTWSLSGSLGKARYAHTAHNISVSGNEKVIVIGGFDLGGASKKVELYHPSIDWWGGVADMNIPRGLHASVVLGDGTILVIGGHTVSAIATAEKYDPTANTWTNIATMSGVRKTHTATLLNDGRVLVTGGTNSAGTQLSSTELYDPVTDTWINGPTMAYPRGLHTATLLPNGNVLIAGGSGTSANKAEIFDPTTDTLSNASNMNYDHASHTANLLTLSDGITQNVLVVGSSTGSTANRKHAELYDYATDTWSITNDMSIDRYNHTGTLLNNGTVLVTGGISSTSVPAGQNKTAEYYTAP